jgi:hypothetical protein
VKLYLKSININETDVEKNWKTKNNNKEIKRRNRRKYLKLWDDRIKHLIEAKKIKHRK